MLPQHNARPPNWYFKFWGMILLLVLFGPLAFPFLWVSKTISKRWKIILTVIFTIATVWITMKSIDVFQKILADFRSVGLIR
jgi:hypothetical protein